jgi:hypothetical protein
MRSRGFAWSEANMHQLRPTQAEQYEHPRRRRYGQSQLTPPSRASTSNATNVTLLVDGYHRVAAAQALGRTRVACEVIAGSRSDALRYAVELAAADRDIRKQDARLAISRRSGPASISG